MSGGFRPFSSLGSQGGFRTFAAIYTNVSYAGSHRAAASFFLAAQNGVRAHQWPFGNMPPVEGLTRGDVKGIVAYVRELQRENGIH